MRGAVVVLLVLVGLAVGGVAIAVFLPPSGYSDEELEAFGYSAYPEPRVVEPFELVDAAGGVFDPERLRGRWSLMFFGFANCPDICPIAMSVLGDAAKTLAERGETPFQGILVTVDPERDTPPELAAYVQTFSEDFVGVTGTVADIKAFARSFHAGFSKAPVEDSALGYLMDHTGRVAVVDPEGRHVGNIRSPFDATRIATLYLALADRNP